ncbi:MAG: HAMP domain-containing protein [Rhodospirillales bacterium]|nr:HAMP domain-containing protein [Rhodospirillales bacterium]
MRTRSLIGRTLGQVAVRIGVVVTIASVLSYWQVRSALQDQALAQLSTYAHERQARESIAFVLSADHLETFAERYLAEYRARDQAPDDQAIAARFRSLFHADPSGNLRLDASVYRSSGITGYVGRFSEVSFDLQRRLLVALDVLARFGPAWRNRFVNLYVITPEHAVLMYWPNHPWALEASDWEIEGKLSLISPASAGVVQLATPERKVGTRLWSNLYFDYGVDDWLVSGIEPANLDGRHLLSVGNDILLRELLDRTLHSDIEGAYTAIFRDDGGLIAHPRFMEAILANGGALTIEQTADPHLQRIFDRARSRSGNETIVENVGDDEYLAVSRLEAPGWWFVTVFPQAVVAARAWAAARGVFLLGLAALLLEIGILYLVLKMQVARPLHRLVEATRQIASGRPHGAIDVERDDELGALARSVSTMAAEIEAREAVLSERSTTLAELNDRLERELEQRRRSEATIARQHEMLRQAEKMKALGSLLAGIAHELNNPLSVVVGRSVLLEEKLRGGPQGEAAQKLRGAAERCGRIVKAFLTMARQQASARQPVRLPHVFEQALELVSSRMRSSGIVVEVDLPAELPEILGDAGQLGQVFSNLLLNAQQAMAEHDGERRVRVSGAFDGDARALVVTVADTGPGVPADIRHRIFEPYFTTKPVGVGTGMGLSICYRIIEVHGGSFGLCADAGRGAVFVMTLPVMPRPGAG